MNVLFIDFESTGLDTSTERITEMGAVLARCEPGKVEQIGWVNHLVYDDTYPALPEIVVKKTGITDELLKAEGIPFVKSLAFLQALLSGHEVSCIVAHNKGFDQAIFMAELSRHEEQIPPGLLAGLRRLPWICSIQDLPHAPELKCKKLSHLALDYGVAVDPSGLHRAINDVELLLKLIAASQFDLAKALERSYKPDVIIRAVIPTPWTDDGVGKQKARECGFGWQEPPGTTGLMFIKIWVKKVKEDEIDHEKEKLGYPVELVRH